MLDALFLDVSTIGRYTLERFNNQPLCWGSLNKKGIPSSVRTVNARKIVDAIVMQLAFTITYM